MFVSRSMTIKVVTIQPDATVLEAQKMMATHHIRHLPVIKDGTPVGILSVMDVVKNIISEKEFIIEQLEHYISGQ